MNMVVASLVAVALLTISIAHFVWSVGATWPIRNEKLLAQTIAGFEGVERMPPKLASLAVALGTLAASVVALSLADPVAGGLTLDLVGGLVGLVFLARGLAGYTDRWQRLTPVEPFRSNDRKLYSPLCLGIAAGFFILIAMRLL